MPFNGFIRVGQMSRSHGLHEVSYGQPSISVLSSPSEEIDHLPDDKMSALSKLRAFADDKLDIMQNNKVHYHRIKKKHCEERRKCW